MEDSSKTAPGKNAAKNKRRKQKKKENSSRSNAQTSEESKPCPFTIKQAKPDDNPLKLDKDTIKQLIEINEVRDAWSPQKFLQTLRYKENEVTLDQINDAITYWQQMVDPMNEMNKALGLKDIQLNKYVENKDAFRLIKDLKGTSDYYSTGSLSPIFKVTKVILLTLLKSNKDPNLNFLIHIIFMNYMSIEKINEILLNRLAGYNIFEQEFQDLMTKDFADFQKRIENLEEQVNRLNETVKNLYGSESKMMKDCFAQIPGNCMDCERAFGLIRKLNARINGIIKRIEKTEDDVDHLWDQSSSDENTQTKSKEKESCSEKKELTISKSKESHSVAEEPHPVESKTDTREADEFIKENALRQEKEMQDMFKDFKYYDDENGEDDEEPEELDDDEFNNLNEICTKKKT